MTFSKTWSPESWSGLVVVVFWTPSLEPLNTVKVGMTAGMWI